MILRCDDDKNDKGIYSRRLSDRYYHGPHGWCFYTREDEVIGPFYDKKTAMQGLNDYLEFLSLASSTTLASFFKSSK